jgi:hypothetical protein
VRTISSELLAVLNSGQFFLADLYTFTLTDGTVLRYTSFDQDITVSGHTFSSALGWERTKWKLAVGLNVDEMEVTLHASQADLIGSTPVIEHIASGAWDGAEALVERAFMPTAGDVSAGTVVIFPGQIATIQEIGRAHCKFQIRSKLALLNVGMPKALFQPSCRHVLFDAGCGLDREDFEETGTVASGSTTQVIQTSLTETGAIAAPAAPTLSSHTASGVNLPPNATYYVQVTYVTAYGETTASAEASLTVTPSNGILRVASPSAATGATGWNVYIGPSSGDEQRQNTAPIAIGTNFDLPYSGVYLSGLRPPDTATNGVYALGVITFTSGANDGRKRKIEISDVSGAITLRVPLPIAPADGDTFSVTPGCDHLMSTCAEKYDNLVHFGGFPFIPVPEQGG